ncbi:mitochondrial carrier domain-containing protein [Pavlovales sp. CCMP2436]|nr:mitochondrial carrier domain-containing protein [Pavlovales sp. CCMP2436]
MAPGDGAALVRRPCSAQLDAALDLTASSAACALGNGIVHPLETIKVREMTSPAGSSAASIALSIVRKEGTGALYAGFNAGLARAVVQGGGRLFLYERCKRALPAGYTKDSDLGRMAAGSAAGAGAALVGSPIDTVRTVQQSVMRRAGTQPLPAGSAFGVAAQLVRDGGVRSLWTGAGAAVTRCAVLTASQCATYDRAKLLTVGFAGWADTDVRAHLAASMLSGVVSTTATAPLDNIKTVQIVSKCGALQAARLVWSGGGGVKGFFRGWGSIYLRLAPHTVIMFCSLEWMRTRLGIRPGSQ